MEVDPADRRARQHSGVRAADRPRTGFGAGAALLAAPVIAVSVGALLATWSATIPAGLQGYPGALAIRFALAVLVAYAVFFAVSAGTARTAGIILGLIGGVILVQIIA